jgi:hypothetical protein
MERSLGRSDRGAQPRSSIIPTDERGSILTRAVRPAPWRADDRRWEEVAIPLHRHLDGRVAGERHDLFDREALLDPERHGEMAHIMPPQDDTDFRAQRLEAALENIGMHLDAAEPVGEIEIALGAAQSPSAQRVLAPTARQAHRATPLPILGRQASGKNRHAGARG